MTVPDCCMPIALVFSRYKVNLHTAKIMTLGERIEDVFLIDSEMLQHPRIQDPVRDRYDRCFESQLNFWDDK